MRGRNARGKTIETPTGRAGPRVLGEGGQETATERVEANAQ